MPLVPTGRSRSASVTVHASQQFVPETAIPAPVGSGFVPGFNQTWANALGASLRLTHQGHPVTYSIDPTYDGPGYRIEWVISVTFQIHHSGIPLPSPIEVDGAMGSGWEVVDTLPVDPIGQANYLLGGINGELTASWTWVEYQDPVTGALSEQAADGSVSVSASGSYVFQVSAEGFEGTLSPVFEYGGTWASNAGIGSSYSVGIDFNCVTDTGNASSVSCEGLQFTAPAATLAAGSAQIIGTGLSATLTKSTVDSLAVGSLRGTPDWALDLQVANYDYETGNPIPVTTRHYTGSTLISTSNTGHHRYPESGYVGDLVGSLSCGGDGVNYARNRSLGACEGAAGANLVRVDPDWADAYGTYADSFQFAGTFSAQNPGRNSQYGLYAGPEFDALTIRLEDEHRFKLFDDVTKLAVNSGTVTADQGGIKIVQSGFLGSWRANQSTGYVFRPIGYRYFRFQAKAGKAGAKFTLRIERKLDNVSGGRFALAYYDFTINAADTWQECVIDLPFASRYFDSVHYTGTAVSSRYPIHPAAFQAFPDDTTVTFETPFGQNTTYWLKDLYGYHPSDGNRVPAILIGPSSCGDPTSDPVNQAPAGFDSCLGTTTNSAGQPRGAHFGRLVVNGVMGWNIQGGPGTLGQQIDALISRYSQSPTNDTGLHLTKGTSPWLDTTDWESGWAIRRPLWSAFPLDTNVTLKGVKRAYVTGYYGSGNFPAGTYGPTLSFQGDKVWNGELLGLCHDTNRSLRDVTLSLVDDPTGTVLEAAASNGDGLVRIFHKYGVPLPFANTPFGGTCASKQAYSGTINNPVYTAKGQQLNAYWVVSPQLRNKDSQNRSNAFRAPDRWPILDRFAYWHDWPTDPAPPAGVDLLQFQTLHLLRSSTEDGDVQVERSGDAGVNWDAPVKVAEDAGSVAVPTLVRNALDQVWCWFHDTTGATQAYLSKNLGASWELYATHAGKRFPRAARQFHRLLVCAHDGTSLRVYQSADDGLNLEEISGLALTCPEQLAALAVDRHDTAHLVYRTTAGALQLRRLEADDTWSDPVTVAASGSQPALALGIRYGLILYWDGNTLKAARTDEAYAEIAETVAAPAGLGVGYLGAVTDLPELHQFVAGRDGTGELIIRYSGDDAATWSEPT